MYESPYCSTYARVLEAFESHDYIFATDLDTSETVESSKLIWTGDETEHEYEIVPGTFTFDSKR